MIEAPSGVDWMVYHRWRPEFEHAIDPQLYPMGWLDDRVWSGTAMFDHTTKAAVLSEWKRYPTGALELEGLVCAGDLGSIVDDIRPIMERRAIDNGALAFSVSSREGWGRTLAPHGFEPYQQTVRKRLAWTSA